MRGTSTRIGWIALAGALALTTATTSSADWKLYVGLDLGISRSAVETDGQAGTIVQTDFFGTDDDSSPLIGGVLGIEIPMDETIPREWTGGVRLPNWPIRFETEVTGLRDYEFQTEAEGEDFFTEVDTQLTYFNNFWLDIPLVSIYSPIQYLLGVGRQPTVRRALGPASFYLGGGPGFSMVEIEGTSNVFSGDDNFLDFAWNVGTGLNYSLTERVAVSAGYRYIGMPSRSIDIAGAVQAGNDEVDFETEIHEFRFQLRVRYWEFRSPWR